jgi:hypothetical protein
MNQLSDIKKNVLNSLLTHLLAVKNQATLDIELYMNDPASYTPVGGLTLQEFLSIRLDQLIAVDSKVTYLQKVFTPNKES